MPRVNIPPTVVTRGGVAAAAEVAGDTVNGHSFPNGNEDVVLIVRNADGAAPHTVTISFDQVVDGQAVAPRAVAVPLSATRYFGPFGRSEYGSVVHVDVDSAQLKLVTLEVTQA